MEESPSSSIDFNRKDSSKISEKICYICDKGSEKILDDYEFNDCHHYYCVFCLFRSIFYNNINDFVDQNVITVKCKCKRGKKKFNFEEINKLLKFKSDIEKNNEKLIQKCRLHDSNCELFCKTCQKYICYHCKVSHSSHKISQNSIFIRMYKDFIKGMPLKYKYPENFKLNLDKSVDGFNKELAEKTNSVIKEINELIDELGNIKKNYILKLKEIQENGLQSINLIKSFYCEYYSDLSNINNDNDIFSLRYLASYKKELENFKMKYNAGIFPKLEDIRNQINNLKSLTEQPFTLKINYIDVPTTFREVIRTIGHDGQINCLSKIEDSKFISGSSDNTIKFWNLEDEDLKPYDSIDKFTGDVGYILLLKDNRICYSSLGENWIKIYERINPLAKGDIQINAEYKYNTLSGHAKAITGIIQLNNNNLVSSSKDNRIIIWEMAEDNFIKSFEIKPAHNSGENGEGVYSICKIGNNNFMSGGAEGKIKFWKKNEENNEYICSQEFGKHNNKIRNLISLKDDSVCSAGDDGFVKVWSKNKEKYQLLWEKEIKDETITCLAGLQNGSFITGSSRKHGIYANMRVWEKNGNEYTIKENIKKHLKKITAVMELDWGNVVSSGEDGVIIVWKSGVLYD